MHPWLGARLRCARDPAHPLQVALRTYALSLSLSLGPSLIPVLTSLLGSKSKFTASQRELKRVFKRELSTNGFAFAMTVAVAGGSALDRLLDRLGRDQTGINDVSKRDMSTALSPAQKTFVANIVSATCSFFLLHANRNGPKHTRRRLDTPPRPSPTLDLTLLFLVRALDVFLQYFLRTKVEHHRSPSRELNIASAVHVDPNEDKVLLKKLKLLTMRSDAVLFWICSARIMWCFFYQPERLPRSYVKWIAALANVDGRLLHTLRLLRERKWSYRAGSPAHSDVLVTLAMDLGRDAHWGHPNYVPAYGGRSADVAWKSLGVTSRPGVGGLPCELIHGKTGSSLGLSSSCMANTLIRGSSAFVEAMIIYLPVHFLPVLLSGRRNSLSTHRLLATAFGALRSATFLSSFIALYWYAVCATRTFFLASAFPFISHDFWDGPYGCILAGSLACGSSIWIEGGRRRGEMALYVLPRAIRTLIPEIWVQRGSKKSRFVERLLFVLSFSMLVTAALHRPKTLRGLSRWTLQFIMNGSGAKRRRNKLHNITTSDSTYGQAQNGTSPHTNHAT